MPEELMTSEGSNQMSSSEHVSLVSWQGDSTSYALSNSFSTVLEGTDVNNLILNSLMLLHDPGDTFELSIASPQIKRHSLWGNENTFGKNTMVSGWFNDPKQTAQFAAQADCQVYPVSIYITINPVSAALLGRANQRLKASIDRTKDLDVTKRKWILIDLDPKRPKGISSTKEEKQAAHELAERVKAYLISKGWCEPILADSGNGYHLLFRIDLPNDDASRELIKGCLKALASIFDNEHVSIDTAVFNAARLIKLWGTITRKGEDIPDRPHRRSGLLQVPEQINILPVEKLQELARVLTEGITQKPEVITNESSNNGKVDLEAYFAHYGVETLGSKRVEGGTMYPLKACVRDPSHGPNEAAIIQFDNGKIIYQDFHDSCQDMTWRKAREIISGNDSLRPFMTGGNWQESLPQASKAEEVCNQKKEVSRILCLAEIAEEQHPENPVIDNLLDELENLLICGQSGIGKSLMGLYIAACLGAPPLNGIWGKFHIPNPVNTLIIQSEVSRKATSKRLRAMIKNNPTLKDGFERVFIPEFRNDVRYIGEFQDKKFQQEVTSMIEATQAKCIILDPLISYHGGDENDNSEMRRSLDTLTELQDRNGLAAILFHHLGKASDKKELNKIFAGRGATAIGDWAANILTLSIVKKEGPEAFIECTHHKARNFPTVPNFYLKRTKDLQLTLTDKPGGEKEQVEVTAVLLALKDMDNQQAETQSQLKKAILAATDWKEKKAQRAIQKAVQTGKVVETPHPNRKQGKCYTLTFDGQLESYALDPENDLLKVASKNLDN